MMQNLCADMPCFRRPGHFYWLLLISWACCSAALLCFVVSSSLSFIVVIFLLFTSECFAQLFYVAHFVLSHWLSVIFLIISFTNDSHTGWHAQNGLANLSKVVLLTVDRNFVTA